MLYSRTRIHILLALLILSAAIFMRFWQLDGIPPGFHYDEAFEGVDAWHILTDPSYRPIFLTRDFGIPPLNAYLNALTFGLFRLVGWAVGPTAMRTTAAATGVLSVVAMWLLASELRYLAPRLSPQFPLWAAGTLAVMRWHIHYSRMGIEAIYVPLLWLLAVWLLLRGWRTRHWGYFLLCGIALALCLYAYMGAWITPILMIPVVLHLAIYTIRQPEEEMEHSPALQRLPWRNTLITVGTAAVLVAPLLGFFWQNPQWLLMRPSQLFIVGETGSPADTTVWDNIRHMAGMYGPLGRPGDMDPRRNLPGAPALNIWLVFPFYVGLALAAWRVRNPAYSIALMSLIGLLLPGVLSEYAPHFNRIQGAAAPTALLCGMGLDALWSWRPVRTRLLHWLALLLLLMGSVTSAYNYFGRWAELPELFYAFDVGLWEVGQWMAAQPDSTTVYVTPRSSDHATLEFAWVTAEKSGEPVSFDGRHVFPFTAGESAQRELYTVIEHEDFRSRLLLPGIFPGAKIVHEVADREGQNYARIYERPVGSVPQVTPQHPLSVDLGDGIELLGYDVQPELLRAGDTLYVQYHWLATAVPNADWTVFTHVLQIAPDGTETQVTGFDNPPGAGSFPTTRWQAGQYILDEHQLLLLPDMEAGTYTLRSGMYRMAGSEIVPLSEPILLGTIQLVP